MVLADNSELVSTCVTMRKEDKRFLRSKGMQQSKFFRQAVKAYKEGKWNYDFMGIG